MMRRRRFLGLAGATVLALPAGAYGERAPGSPAAIGMLSPFTQSETEAWHQAFRTALRELGWVEGSNVRFEYRYADGHEERLPDLAEDLVRLTPDVILVTVNSDALPAKKATKTVPIVMASPGDPVSTGLIASLAHPGGNVTGLTNIDTDLAAKRLQLLKEVAPRISRVAVLWDPRVAFSALAWREIQEPADRLGISLHSFELHSNSDVDAALALVVESQDDGLFALQGPIFVVNEKRIADFAVKHRLPTVSHLPEFVRHGGLLSYGADRVDLFRRAATYVDKILKGAKPADLPVEQASKFQLAINLRTANAIGLAVPQSIFARADEVIE